MTSGGNNFNDFPVNQLTNLLWWTAKAEVATLGL